MSENLSPAEYAQLGALLGKLAAYAHDHSRHQGFWESTDPRHNMAIHEVAAKIALISAEASELLEAWRLRDPWGPCAKDPSMSHLSEEVADVAIRLLDLCAFLGINLAEAIAAKSAYNALRPYKHSKRF